MKESDASEWKRALSGYLKVWFKSNYEQSDKEMNGSHSKKQKDWMNTISEHGCVITGDCHNIQRHHVYGASYKHNGVLIGPWYILPLHVRLHDISSSEPINVTHNRTLFTEEHGLQKDLFLAMCNDLIRYAIELPFSADVLAAIMDTDR